MLRSFCALLALTQVQATFNALQNAGVVVKDNNGATVNPANWFDFSGNTQAVTNTAVTFVTFQFPYAINLKSFYVRLNDADTTNSVKIQTSVDGVSFTQCGGTFTQTLIQACEKVVTHIKVEQPIKVQDLCAFVWKANPATPTASMYAATESSGQPVNSPLMITTSKKLLTIDSYYTYSTVSAPTCVDPQSKCRWWKMQYTTSVYVRYVIVLKNSVSPQTLTVYAYNSIETRSSVHQCSLSSPSIIMSAVVFKCGRAAQVIELRWADADDVKLYYVKDFIAPATCMTLINGGCSLASFTTGLSTLSTSLYMSSPSTTVPLSSITSFNQSCCPLTWFVDTSATTPGFPVTIDVATQNLIMSPTPAIYHAQTDVTLSVKFVFWEGSASPSLSPLNSLQITISCSTTSEEKFTIGGNFVESVLTSYTGLLGFPDFSPCLGTSPTYQLNQASYTGYVLTLDDSLFTFSLDFSKRLSTAYSDGPFYLEQKGVSRSDITKWYTLSQRLDSIDCIRGLTLPNPLRLTLGTGPKFADVRQTSSKICMTSTDITTITITDSSWTFEVVSPVTDPISSCGSITASIVSDVPGFVSSTANPLVFQLNLNKVIPGTTVINMKLQLQNINLPAPQEFPFTIEGDCASTIISSGSQPSHPVSWSVPNTVMTNDFKYTWNAFNFFPLCPVDTYQVTCTEGVGNIGSGRCTQGFQYNESLTTPLLASINSLGSPMIPALTIYAQYDPINPAAITLDHEGEFTFKIEGWYSGALTNKGTFSIILKITVPCDNPDNVIIPQVHQFICSTGLCNDVFYTIFTNQQNTFVTDTHRFSYSCRMTFTLQVNSLPAPAFISLKDASGNPAYQDDLNPVILEINSSSNDDYVAYSGKTLTLVLSVGTGAGLKTMSRSYGLNIFPDCTASKAPMATQTLPTNPFSFIVSQQHLPLSYGYVNSLTFGKFEPANPTDKAACAVNDAGLSLNQIDRISTPTPTTSYDPNLFNFVKNQAGSTNKIEIKPSFNSHVKFDGPEDACDLSILSTDKCAVRFKIDATNLNSTQVVVEGTVNFETECKLIADWEKYRRDIGKPSSWQWTLASFQSYRVRDSPLEQAMPTFHGKLPSIDHDVLAVPAPTSQSLTDLCGDLTYLLTGVNTPVPFELKRDPTPNLYVYSDDPETADKNHLSFTRTYPLTYSVTFNLNLALMFTYTDKPLLFKIRDPCFGLTYSAPSIEYTHYYDGLQNGPILKVTQFALAPKISVFFPWQDYNSVEYGKNTGCGTLQYSAEIYKKFSVLNWGTVSTTEKIQVSPKGLNFSVFASSQYMKGNYWVAYTALMGGLNKSTLYPQLKMNITVIMEDCIIESFLPQTNSVNLVFYLSGKPAEFSFKEFKQHYACEYPTEYIFSQFDVSKTNVPPAFLEGATFSPSPLTYDQVSKTVSLSTTNEKLVNSTYIFYITGRVFIPQNPQQKSFNWGPFNATIKEPQYLIANTGPAMPELKSNYLIMKGQKSTISLGAAVDLEGNKIALTEWDVSSSAVDWVKLGKSVNKDDVKSIEFDVDPPSYSEINSIRITFSLQDDHKSQQIQTHFSTSFQLTNNPYESITKNSEMNRLAAQFLQNLPPAVVPTKFTNSGGFTFKFDKAVKLEVISNFAQLNNTNGGEDYFKFELVVGDTGYYEINQLGYAFTWNITNITSTEVQFQIQFADYSIISGGVALDKMRFRTLRPELFVSETSNKPLDFKSSIQSLPRQVRSIQEAERLQNVSNRLEVILKALSASSAANFFLSQSMQYLWGMINSLQVQVLTVLFNLQTPVNAQEIQIHILKLVSFDVIKTADIYNKIFKFEAVTAGQQDDDKEEQAKETDESQQRRLSSSEELTPPINRNFAAAGYDTSNFILGMGPLFAVELVYILIFILVPSGKWFFADNVCPGRFANYVLKLETFPMFFRFYLEGAFEICINTLISFRMMSAKSWSTGQLRFANLFMLLNFGVLVYLPFKTFGITRKYVKTYRTGYTYRRKYNWMFSELKASEMWSALFHLCFICRRYVITICLVAMPMNTLFQIYLQAISSTAFVLYLLHTKPFVEPSQNRMEIMNELFISAGCYFLFLFTDLVLLNETRYTLGWILCVHIGLLLVVNLSIVAYQTISERIKAFKIWRALRKLKKLQASYQEKRKEWKEQQAENEQGIEEPQAPIEQRRGRKNWRALVTSDRQTRIRQMHYRLKQKREDMRKLQAEMNQLLQPEQDYDDFIIHPSRRPPGLDEFLNQRQLQVRNKLHYEEQDSDDDYVIHPSLRPQGINELLNDRKRKVKNELVHEEPNSDDDYVIHPSLRPPGINELLNDRKRQVKNELVNEEPDDDNDFVIHPSLRPPGINELLNDKKRLEQNEFTNKRGNITDMVEHLVHHNPLGSLTLQPKTVMDRLEDHWNQLAANQETKSQASSFDFSKDKETLKSETHTEYGRLNKCQTARRPISSLVINAPMTNPRKVTFEDDKLMASKLISDLKPEPKPNNFENTSQPIKQQITMPSEYDRDIPDYFYLTKEQEEQYKLNRRRRFVSPSVWTGPIRKRKPLNEETKTPNSHGYSVAGDEFLYMKNYASDPDEFARPGAAQKPLQQQVNKLHLMQPEPKDPFKALQEARSRQASPQIKQPMTSTSARQPSRLFMNSATYSMTPKTTLTQSYLQPQRDNYHLGERQQPQSQANAQATQTRSNSVNSNHSYASAAMPDFKRPTKQQMMKLL